VLRVRVAPFVSLWPASAPGGAFTLFSYPPAKKPNSTKSMPNCGLCRSFLFISSWASFLLPHLVKPNKNDKTQKPQKKEEVTGRIGLSSLYFLAVIPGHGLHHLCVCWGLDIRFSRTGSVAGREGELEGWLVVVVVEVVAGEPLNRREKLFYFPPPHMRARDGRRRPCMEA
jgi:hypothetical protein